MEPDTWVYFATIANGMDAAQYLEDELLGKNGQQTINRRPVTMWTWLKVRIAGGARDAQVCEQPQSLEHCVALTVV